MSEPLDLDAFAMGWEGFDPEIDALLAEVYRLREHDKEVYRRGYADGCNDAKMRAEISDRANVEADLRAQLAELTEAVPDAWEEGFADGANYMTKYTPKRANPYPGPP